MANTTVGKPDPDPTKGTQKISSPQTLSSNEFQAITRAASLHFSHDSSNRPAQLIEMGLGEFLPKILFDGSAATFALHVVHQFANWHAADGRSAFAHLVDALKYSATPLSSELENKVLELWPNVDPSGFAATKAKTLTETLAQLPHFFFGNERIQFMYVAGLDDQAMRVNFAGTSTTFVNELTQYGRAANLPTILRASSLIANATSAPDTATRQFRDAYLADSFTGAETTATPSELISKSEHHALKYEDRLKVWQTLLKADVPDALSFAYAIAANPKLKPVWGRLNGVGDGTQSWTVIAESMSLSERYGRNADGEYMMGVLLQTAIPHLSEADASFLTHIIATYDLLPASS